MNAQHVHLIGIGGSGLSAIARVLLEEGHRVSGSDRQLSPLTAELARLGATIHHGHRPENVGQADVVLISSAVPDDNPEVIAARQRGIPVVKRAEFLGEMMAGRYGVAVAGTHGKTTTTAMIATILTEAGLDPTFIVGSVVDNLGTNAHAGRGPHFIIEADEYDHTFLGLRPRLAVVTTVEHDHPDCFPTIEAVMDAFTRFVALVPDDGGLIVCGDDPNARRLGTMGMGDAGGIPPSAPSRKVLTYGLGEGWDWQAVDLQPNDVGGSDFVALRHGRPAGDVRLRIPGRHNVLNALAALAVADELGIPPAQAGASLAAFRGTKRRFEHKGTVGGVTVIDDYAHHPTEIRATLAAARERYPERRIWAVFQPHTYSRTKALLDEFAASFADADHVIVTDIFAARERDTLGLSADDIVQRMAHPDARHIAGLEAVADHLLAHLRPGDVLITLGAGDGYLIGERVLREMTAHDSRGPLTEAGKAGRSPVGRASPSEE